MKAIAQDRYGTADVLQLREVDRPSIGEDDVLIRVHAAGVDRGVWHLMTGRPYLVRLGFGLRKPKASVRGSDVAGVVEAIGNNVNDFAPGDAVFGSSTGSFAEFAKARAKDVVRKPANLTFEQAAAVPVSGLAALQGLRRGELEAGQNVLIIGAAGGVGTFAVQLAKCFGATVTGVCSTSKLDLVRSIGADDVIDYTEHEITDGPSRYDVILDTAGNRPLSVLRRALTRRGTLVIAGGESPGRWFGGTGRLLRAPALSPLTSQRLRTLLSLPRKADLLELADLLEAGRITPVIDSTYPLDEAADAVRHLEHGHPGGKIVIAV